MCPSFGTKVRAAIKSEVVWCWGGTADGGRQKVESLYILLLSSPLLGDYGGQTRYGARA